ncbi:MAG: VacJ family lipoprotein [Proteobacteria bacterium]|nr:VacJ family lipoprotein [Pseudomonadota bacterium]
MSRKKISLFVLSFVCLAFIDEAFAQDQNKPNKFLTEDESEFEIYSDANVEQIYDPLEKYNRKIFVFNDFLDRYFFEYVAKTYRNFPKPARNAIRNFLNNLSAPVSAFNSALQGKTENGLASFSNFLMNSTIGIGGLFNVAEEKGIRYKEEDFGQTLGHYGVKSGAYLMVPFIGPSSVRDIAGMTTDQVISPASYNIFKIGGKTYLIGRKTLYVTTTLNAVDTRENLLDIVDDARRDSFDLYATLRSAYAQRRISEIQN